MLHSAYTNIFVPAPAGMRPIACCIQKFAVQKFQECAAAACALVAIENTPLRKASTRLSGKFLWVCLKFSIAPFETALALPIVYLNIFNKRITRLANSKYVLGLRAAHRFLFLKSSNHRVLAFVKTHPLTAHRIRKSLILLCS